MNIDQKYMLRAVQLGKNALGTAAPNPMVGCVVLHEEKIIGEGYTSPYGGPHAEVNAIASVKDKALLSKSTLYVTLEPCSHFGKTPPCADLILKHKIPHIVIGLLDPNEKVAGKGIKKLKDAGCKVKVGVLEDACKKHHKRFLSFQEKKRPYIILKWAESFDGFIAPSKQLRNDKKEPFWISNAKSQQLVHQWRSEEMAILVGTNTALEDNPKLDVRHWAGKSPIRIVLDRQLKIPDSYHLFDGSVKTLVITEKDMVSNKENVTYYKLDSEEDFLQQLMQILHKENINSLIVEGGQQTLQAFIDADLWDEARVFKSLSILKNGVKAPNSKGRVISSEKILNDTLTTLVND